MFAVTKNCVTVCHFLQCQLLCPSKHILHCPQSHFKTTHASHFCSTVPNYKQQSPICLGYLRTMSSFKEPSLLSSFPSTCFLQKKTIFSNKMNLLTFSYIFSMTLAQNLRLRSDEWMNRRSWNSSLKSPNTQETWSDSPWILLLC